MTINFSKGQQGKISKENKTVWHVLFPYLKYKLRFDKNNLYLKLQNKYLNFQIYDSNGSLAKKNWCHKKTLKKYD